MVTKKWADYAMVSLEWAGKDLFIREILPIVPFLDQNFGTPLDAMYVVRRKAVGQRGADEGEMRTQELDYVSDCLKAFESFLLKNIKELIARNPGDESLKFRNVANILFRLEYTCERFAPIVKNQVKSIRDVFAPLLLTKIDSISIQKFWELEG